MGEIKKCYRKKLQKVPYFISFVMACVISTTIFLPAIEKYSDDKDLFITIWVIFFGSLVLRIFYDFGHKVCVDHETAHVTESICDFVYSDINVSNIEKIYYRVEPFGAGLRSMMMVENIPSRVVEIQLNGGEVLRKKWRITQKELYDLFRDMKEINGNIHIYTNVVELGPESAQYGEQLDKGELYRIRKIDLPLVLIAIVISLIVFLSIAIFY